MQGKRFGRLVVMAQHGVTAHQKKTWDCLCDCGKATIVTTGGLNSGKTRSCGCLRAETKGNFRHGFRQVNKGKQSRLYTAWVNMKRRCTAANEVAYKNYGGRGITYESAWEIFENFAKDMGEPPVGGTLDRINNDGNYCKDNCRWASRKEQALNTRQNHIIEYEGLSATIYEWAEWLNIPYGTLYDRIKNGWSLDRALSSGKFHRFGNFTSTS